MKATELLKQQHRDVTKLFKAFEAEKSDAKQREIFEELVHAARQLAERLGGLITDQHGEELTPERIARLRQSLESAPPAARAGQG